MSGYNTNLVETSSITIDGNPLVSYNIALHVRAAVELMSYSGGVGSGYFQTGGAPQSYVNTRLKLVTNTPAATYYLNRSASVPTPFSVPLDYYATITVKGGATLTLSVERGDHSMLSADQGGGLVKTTLTPYDGEFVQLDFVTTLAGPVYETRATRGVGRGWVFSGYEENMYGDKAEK